MFQGMVNLLQRLVIQVDGVVPIVEADLVEGEFRIRIFVGVGIDVHAVIAEWVERLVEHISSAFGRVEGLLPYLLQFLPDDPDSVNTGVKNHEEWIKG